MSQQITWETTTHEQFQKILEEIPDMIRGIAEVRVRKRAENIVQQAGRSVITEKDMVNAFFAETPPGFIGLMKKSLERLGVDYTKYGHQ